MATLTRRTPPAPPIRPQLAALTPTHLAPGREVTIGRYIVEQIRQGVDPVNAGGVCGVSPAEFTAWMREGTLARNRLHAGANWLTDFTPDEQDCCVFADDVSKAHSEHIARLSVTTELAARGGGKKTKTTTTTNPAGLVTVTVVEETLPADSSVAQWKLERLEARIYGNRATLDVSITDMTDTEQVGDSIARRMLEVAAALTAAIETTAVEVTSGPDDHGA